MNFPRARLPQNVNNSNIITYILTTVLFPLYNIITGVTLRTVPLTLTWTWDWSTGTSAVRCPCPHTTLWWWPAAWSSTRLRTPARGPWAASPSSCRTDPTTMRPATWVTIRDIIAAVMIIMTPLTITCSDTPRLLLWVCCHLQAEVLYDVTTIRVGGQMTSMTTTDWQMTKVTIQWLSV